MKGKDTSLLSLMKGNYVFSIPIYQRKYSWPQTQCRTLLDSIVKISNDTFREWHFLGSIIYLSKEEEMLAGTNEFQIIDGQQRLTTMSLLLLALLDMPDASDHLKKEISRYLFNLEEFSFSDPEYIKLHLREEDDLVYRRLLEDRSLPSEVKSSKIYDNYRFFIRTISQESIPVDVLFNGIQKLKIINFALKKTDNAQFVFETVNSTGLPLYAHDKIRNFIFMAENDEEKQIKLYKNYWHPMEKMLGLTDGDGRIFNDFFWYYLIVVTQSPISTDLYEVFKDYYYANSKNGIENEVQSIYQFSKYFHLFVSAEQTQDELINYLVKLRNTNLWSMTPVILKTLDLQNSEALSRSDAIRILKTLYSYGMRRTICQCPTNSLNGAFITLLKDLNMNRSANSFVKTITSTEGNPFTYAQRFPTDEEMVAHLKTSQFYMDKVHARKILDLLEQYFNKDYAHNDKHSIEHVMPETIESHDSLFARSDLSDEIKEMKDWAKDLGEGWEETYSKYTHTIGNLTLTGYNSEYQNYRFKYKLDMQEDAEDGKKYGYRYSPINLTTSIAQKTKWGESEIIERSEYLATILTKIWPRP